MSRENSQELLKVLVHPFIVSNLDGILCVTGKVTADTISSDVLILAKKANKGLRVSMLHSIYFPVNSARECKQLGVTDATRLY
ncbi:hypothetical protein CARUB_v10012790mg [Capsella rubella]|uniref:Uncharacterized protein n=1 Tax=Capsella rubella TaxID=81985 RepID=R0G636_9BRAS|nr:hypothetical protein CARUB_v10012790mg [Capsella rubella]